MEDNCINNVQSSEFNALVADFNALAANCEIYAKKNTPKISKVNIMVDSYGISPDDDIEISYHFEQSLNGIDDVHMVSKTIKFKDLCKAIAEQLVNNDLAIESEK